MGSMSWAYDEIVDFIAGGSTQAEVMSFQPSEETRAKVWDLLERAKTGSLLEEEREDLNHFLELEHIMRLAKARARVLSSSQGD